MDGDCDRLQAEYTQLTSLARSHDSSAFVAIGTRFCPTFITFSDLMVEFAETWPMYQGYVSPSWMPGGSPQRFAHFVSEVPASEASHALSMAVGFGAGWVFTTDGTLPIRGAPCRAITIKSWRRCARSTDERRRGRYCRPASAGAQAPWCATTVPALRAVHGSGYVWPSQPQTPATMIGVSVLLMRMLQPAVVDVQVPTGLSQLAGAQ